MKEKRELIQRPTNGAAEIDHEFDNAVAFGLGRYPSYHGPYASEAFGLFEYWRAVRKRLWLVAGIAVLVTTWTAIYMARKPNVYSARAVIQVDLEQTNPDLITSESKRPLSNPDPSYFNTQLQLLNSDSLLRRVIKEHSLDTNKELQKAKNESSALRSLLKTVGLAGSDQSNTNSATTNAANENSPLVPAEDIAEAIRLSPYVNLIKRNLSIEPIRESRASVKDTRLIEISYRDTDPEFASFVANSIAQTFSDQNQEKRSGTSRKTNDFLQERIADLQSEIKNDEQQLVDLKKNEGILKTEGDQTIVIDRLSGLNKQLLEAENNRKNAEAAYFAVKDAPDKARALAEDQVGRYITERENDIVSLRNDTQKKVADLRAAKAKLLQEYKESAPEIKEIDTQIKSLEDSLAKAVDKNDNDLQDYRNRSTANLVENLRTRYQQAKDAEDKIRAAFDAQYNEAQGQNQGAVMLKLLEQKIDTNKGFLENLIKQQSSNDIAARGTDNNISVAEIAVPPDEPVSPRRVLSVGLALILSTMFGVGLALFLEYLDDTVRSTDEVENYLQLPALAAIPIIDSMAKRRLLLVGPGNEDGDHAKSELLIQSDPRSSLAEAYRQLRTSILLSTAGRAPKTLLVTSSLPSEGKTITTANTAVSLAQTGAKVLIVDADMRRPRIHTVFGMENGSGLSSLLSSPAKEEDVLELIKFDTSSNLYVMTSGPVPPNPAELIGSEQMTSLLKILQNNFTHVVIDSPPIASFTDGVLIASMVDGVILVVQAGRCSRQVLKRSRQLLTDIGARIFGVILNQAKLGAKENHYYYESYYHADHYNGSAEKNEV
jgi:capsular exopolysaccharide synthesis family protein